MNPTNEKRRQQVWEVLSAALQTVDPAAAVRRVMRRDGAILWVDETAYDLALYRRVLVIGSGKAGAPMAQAVESILGDRIAAGVVNVKYGYTAPTQIIQLREAGHPVPDAAGVVGAQAMIDLLRDSTTEDLVLCLISGGGSALMTLPVEGVTLDDMRVLTDLLLRSGAPIQALNTVRKHLSQISGGQLAQLAQPANVISLILSDVVGSPLDVIASGPTVPDTTTFAEAVAVLDHYRIADRVPESIRRHLAAGAAGEIPDTPKSLPDIQNVIVADNARATQAALERAESLGFHPLLLSTFIEGEARDVAKVLAAIAKEIACADRPVARPACVILGGETTVTVRGSGKGGRNQELALAAALAIQGMENVIIASLATDGSDGPTDAAGGMVDGLTVQRGQPLGLSAQAALDHNDAYPYLAQVGDLLVTGPTNTNVNDLMAVFVW
jgi:hydroxypyruvate reductase